MSRPPHRGRPATIIDVAEAAGVSRQTVTRAMNDMPGISRVTKERVLEVAKELSYRPSRYGRGLVGHSRRTIGLVVDDLTNPYYPQLASAVVSSATERGWNVMLAQTAGAADEAALVADLAAQADVLIGYPRTADGAPHDALVGVPFVHVDAGPSTPGGGVELDATAAMEDLADHLIERGARRPALLDVGTGTVATDRGRSFMRAMATRGVPAVRQTCELSTFGSGASGARALLAAHPGVDAVMAFNDVMACGVLRAMHESGVEVPGQLRLAGCDGLDLGTVVHPALTTLALDMAEVARAAVGMALGMFEGTVPLEGYRTRVRHRLLVRSST
ncbi:LacI family DNA-binding transcriptional regulator [Pseudactinotalea terrae]|uniref:LacI family DNA-binding transcriptional regulator n=1 Tax=Pseudactinotalea terrae TaxID=1743262 RepID=UPI001F4FCBD3|nr:LacI family DNA-binding transcriptional regulator [Pseudactinotalea terrae]